MRLQFTVPVVFCCLEFKGKCCLAVVLTFLCYIFHCLFYGCFCFFRGLFAESICVSFSSLIFDVFLC